MRHDEYIDAVGTLARAAQKASACWGIDAEDGNRVTTTEYWPIERRSVLAAARVAFKARVPDSLDAREQNVIKDLMSAVVLFFFSNEKAAQSIWPYLRRQQEAELIKNDPTLGTIWLTSTGKAIKVKDCGCSQKRRVAIAAVCEKLYQEFPQTRETTTTRQVCPEVYLVEGQRPEDGQQCVLKVNHKSPHHTTEDGQEFGEEVDPIAARARRAGPGQRLGRIPPPRPAQTAPAAETDGDGEDSHDSADPLDGFLSTEPEQHGEDQDSEFSEDFDAANAS